MKLPQSNGSRGSNSLKFGICSVYDETDSIYPSRKTRNQGSCNIRAYSPGAWWVKNEANCIHPRCNSSIHISWRL
jgi:hypothetical protein